MAEAEEDEAMLAELFAHLEELKQEAKRHELEALLSGELDKNDAYLEVHAGSGGTEAQDWAEMLLRMYSRWAEKHKYKLSYVEETEGEVAGLKSATVKISGHNAYGWLKGESGVHRLVRISPFDSNARRHTSFASVNVYPVVDDSIHIDINPADLKMDTYRSSGAGRAAHQQDRIGGADYAYSERGGGFVPDRAFAVCQPRPGNEYAEGKAV